MGRFEDIVVEAQITLWKAVFIISITNSKFVNVDYQKKDLGFMRKCDYMLNTNVFVCN